MKPSISLWQGTDDYYCLSTLLFKRGYVLQDLECITSSVSLSSKHHPSEKCKSVYLIGEAKLNIYITGI
jgi:hypothetical protein